ncbi:endonuclease V, partial [Candidatus Woesearchaeota archaeon]|nr:endonuclease V [Candidatus Woesearchaeota archaeon]
VKDEFDEIKLVGGVDQAFKDNKIISAFVVCDYKTMEVIERKYVVVEASMPYISGYLSYREAPAIVEAYLKLENKPDVILVDAHGIAHPRKLGMASHVGLLLDKTTVGVAKKLLVGEIKEDKIIVEEKVRGYGLVTKEYARPIFVSPGHKIGLKTSLEIVKNCMKLPHKLPEPIHLAHRYANKIREKLEFKQ